MFAERLDEQARPAGLFEMQAFARIVRADLDEDPTDGAEELGDEPPLKRPSAEDRRGEEGGSGANGPRASLPRAARSRSESRRRRRA
jgi:hypothetical protein